MLARVFPSGSSPVTRRRLLVGAAGVPLLLSASACTQDPADDLPVDPDREALEAAYEVEAATLASLEGWSLKANDSTVTPTEARTVINAHISALAMALSATPSAAPSSSGSESYELVPTLSTAQTAAVLDSAADDHTRALRSASPEISPLLASIAASDAALAAALRRSS